MSYLSHRLQLPLLIPCGFSASHTAQQVLLALLPRSVQNRPSPSISTPPPLSRPLLSPAWVSRQSPNWFSRLLLRFLLPRAARVVLKHNLDHVTMLCDRAHVLFISAFHSPKQMFVELNVRFHPDCNAQHGADSRVWPTPVVSLLPLWLMCGRSNPSRLFASPPACQGPAAQTPTSALGCLLLTFGVSVTQGRCPHVTQPDCPFAAAVHEGVAVMGVELSRRDHLRELLHVGRLNVDNIWHRRVKERTGRRGADAWG